MKTNPRCTPAVMAGLLTATLACTTQRALAADITYRNFSPAAAMGPPADAYAAKLQSITGTVLGPTGEVRFQRLPGTPAIPAKFSGNIVSAVGAGVAGGGFDAAYNSGSELNKAWGFIFNSGVPFGPSFDEFLGFLYGRSVDGNQTGLELIQSLLDLNGRNVVVFPIVGNAEQLSGFFPRPIGDVRGQRGIGLAGLCAQPWTLRYLPPGENVLGQACDDLVAEGEISAKNLKFIAAIPGGGSLVDAVKSGQLQGFEFATPLDDLSTLFTGVDNPGTVGVPYVHLPGWQQQFLITWLLVNKTVWNGLTPAQQACIDALEASVRRTLGRGGWLIGGRTADAAARDLIAEAGHAAHFGHGTGHGIGLATHEAPRLSYAAPDDSLPSPTVFSVEPGVYLAGETGVRIEDLVLLDGGARRVERLTRFPRDILVVGG
jgi:TRAP-type mannitol/chloroaromatic compound transport system substrate-binding protein